MKTNGLDLELQAYADGQLEELAPARRDELERLLATDAAARAQVDGLRSLRRLLRENEPVHAVPASRDFYWSQVQRRIAAAAQAAPAGRRAAPTAAPAGAWLRWWLPVFGTAAVGLLTLLVSIGGFGERAGRGEPSVLENGSADSGAVVFRSEAEGVTICWLD